MHWLLWVVVSVVIFIIVLRIALVEYAKTIPNFGNQIPVTIKNESEYKESEQWQSYQSKVEKISTDAKNREIRMYKKNTNTYRAKEIRKGNRLNFNVFNNVIGININKSIGKDKNGEEIYWADVEASCTYDTFVAQLLPFGFIPTIIPELKSITVGGAIVGGGIESSSFKYGLVHESMFELDVLLGDGSVITCNGDQSNEHNELFYAIPNSLGSLGYLLRCRMRIIPCKKYILMTNIYCNNHNDLSKRIINECNEWDINNNNKFDFIDGIAYPDFEGTGRVLYGKMINDISIYTNGNGNNNNRNNNNNDPPLLSSSDESKDNSNNNNNNNIPLLASDEIYHRYVNQYRDNNANNDENGIQFIMKIEDYIWRWDSDLFWCIQYIVPLQNKLLRWYLSPYIMRSDSLRHLHQKIFGRDIIVQTKQETEKGNQMFIQDIMVPSKNVKNWLDFHCNDLLKLTILSKDPLMVKHPVWLCPTLGNNTKYPLCKVQNNTININFGFWSTIEWDKSKRNNMNVDEYIEIGIKKNNAIKMIYSTIAYTKDEFYNIYDNDKVYFKLKKKYDPNNKIRSLYEKVTQK